MATYNANSIPQDITCLSCDICGSDDIIATTEGYICRSCGIVLKIQKLQYNRPYNDDIVQYARGLGATQIGTRRERLISSNSSALNRLNKHNSSKDNGKAVLERARIEISRVFTCLDLADYNDIKQMVYDKFVIVREEIRSGSKFRNVNKLVSVMTYFCLKLRAIPVNASAIIEFCDISRKEFNAFFLQVRMYLPKVTYRERQDYIVQRILDVSETFGLGMPFYYLSKKIMSRLWENIKNTTDNVIAGLISSIAILTAYRDQISVSKVCKRLGIRMSTIQDQVYKKIVSKLSKVKFVSLVKSADLLCEIMDKLGLLNVRSNCAEHLEVPYPETIQITLGRTREIFNGKDTYEFYFQLIVESPLAKFVSELRKSLSCQKQEFLQPFSIPIFNVSDSELSVYNFHNAKGPPLLAT